MKITYTKHSLKKFKDLKELGINVKKKHIANVVQHPEHIDITTDYPKKIASINFNDRLTLRVVYKEENGTIIIITFYPTKKGRYV